MQESIKRADRFLDRGGYSGEAYHPVCPLSRFGVEITAGELD